MEDLRAERERMQRLIERHARRRRFNNFFKIFSNALIWIVKIADGFQTRAVQPQFERFHAFYA